MVARNEIIWLTWDYQRDVVLSASSLATQRRQASIEFTCALITRTTRGIRSEVTIEPDEGRPEAGVINYDAIITVPVEALDAQPVGHLNEIKRSELDRAVRYALDILY